MPRRFEKGFSGIVVPLKDLLCREKPLRWNNLELNVKETFHALKDTPVTPPILAPRRRNGYVPVEIDACDRKLGAVMLLAQVDGTNKPIFFFSRSLTAAERNYDKTRCECSAAV